MRPWTYSCFSRFTWLYLLTHVKLIFFILFSRLGYTTYKVGIWLLFNILFFVFCLFDISSSWYLILLYEDWTAFETGEKLFGFLAFDLCRLFSVLLYNFFDGIMYFWFLFFWVRNWFLSEFCICREIVLRLNLELAFWLRVSLGN